VELRRSGRPARQDEVVEVRQLLRQLVHQPFEGLDVPRLDRRHRHPHLVLLEDAEVRADVEELVLYPGQRLGQPRGEPERHGDADLRGELVDRAVGLDPDRILRHPLPPAEAGGPIVASAGVDPGDSRHSRTPF